ncbi:MAG: universal stress protein [Planctomycetota bacterium]
MNKFLSKTIIVPWDFSEMSKAALQTTIEMVDGKLDQIEVVHVTAYPSAVEPGVVWGTLDEDTIADNLTKSFSAFLGDVATGIKFTTLFGDPGSQVAQLAGERDAGLVVISSHGRTGLNRLLLGSVAERVVRLAPCPVLVLRGETEE